MGNATGWPVIREAYDRLRPPAPLGVSGRKQLLSVERRLLSEEYRRYREGIKARASGTPVVLDTGFIGPLTYVWGLRSLGGFPDVLGAVRREVLHAIREGGWGMADLSIYLDLPPAIARARSVTVRRTHPLRYEARHQRVASKERELWVSRFPRRLVRRVVVIDGRASLPRLVARVRAEVAHRSNLGPIPPEATAQLLGSFRAFGNR